jgi:hypothetical protein
VFTRSFVLTLVLTAVVVVVTATPGHAAAGHLEGILPSAAHAPGRFGSFWTTDVWIYQQGASTVHLWFNPSGQDNTAVESLVVTLADPVTHLPDVVSTLFGTDGVGSIHYLADGPVTVTSRTWTTEPGGGSYGQTIVGVPVSQSSVDGTGQAGALRMVVDQSVDFRANLGLVNISGVGATVSVEIFTADGEDAPGNSSFTVDLAPFAMTQLNDVLARLGDGERRGLIIRAAVVSQQGAILAYLSEVDNRTNDASYQEAFRFGY